jgi:hypothetical protein
MEKVKMVTETTRNGSVPMFGASTCLFIKWMITVQMDLFTLRSIHKAA